MQITYQLNRSWLPSKERFTILKKRFEINFEPSFLVSVGDLTVGYSYNFQVGVRLAATLPKKMANRQEYLLLQKRFYQKAESKIQEFEHQEEVLESVQNLHCSS